ncbi:MAG: hypothetical protein HWD62_14180 [Cyclobacteriaceae bacterium]|nr:MAG: hypothetical protein HWD62_14180 [Cyclobacteriaceae bacterium]
MIFKESSDELADLYLGLLQKHTKKLKNGDQSSATKQAIKFYVDLLIEKGDVACKEIDKLKYLFEHYLLSKTTKGMSPFGVGFKNLLKLTAFRNKTNDNLISQFKHHLISNL